MTKKRLLLSLFAFMLLATVATGTLIVPTLVRKSVHAHAPCYGQTCNGMLPLSTSCMDTQDLGPVMEIDDRYGVLVKGYNVYSSSCNANWTEVTYVDPRAQSAGISLYTKYENDSGFCSAFPGSDSYGTCVGPQDYFGAATPIVTDMVDGNGPVQSCIYVDNYESSSLCRER